MQPRIDQRCAIAHSVPWLRWGGGGMISRLMLSVVGPRKVPGMNALTLASRKGATAELLFQRICFRQEWARRAQALPRRCRCNL